MTLPKQACTHKHTCILWGNKWEYEMCPSVHDWQKGMTFSLADGGGVVKHTPIYFNDKCKSQKSTPQ